MKATDHHGLTLDVGPGFRLPDLPGERVARHVVRTVHVDTTDHRLAIAGVSLSRVLEAGTSRWKLTLPRGNGRLELEIPEPGGRRRRSSEPPPELADLVTAYSRGAALAPIVTLRSRREGVIVRDAAGPVAEVVLDSVQAVDGQASNRRFREIDLIGSDQAALDDIRNKLRGAGATDGDGRSAVLRALGIDHSPAVEEAPADASPRERLRAVIAAQRDAIVGHDAGTRLGHDPEPLHQMRVACRRLRTVLRESQDMLEPAWVEILRAELEWLGDELGAVRDLDVLRRRLSDEIATLDPADARGGAQLLRALDADRTRARAELLAALRSDRYVQVLGALDEAARQPRMAGDEIPMEDIARVAFKRLRKVVRKLGDEPAAEALHDVRIKAKRARYAAELAAPAAGRPAERFIKRAKDLQDLLGDHQDAVVAGQRLRELAGRAGGAASAFAAGRLIERQLRRREEILGEFPKRWRKLDKRGLKAWQ